MRLVEAVYNRILELAKERNMNLNCFGNLCGVPRSTIATMTRSTTVKLSTIYSICDGLQISLEDFFSSKLFNLNELLD